MSPSKTMTPRQNWIDSADAFVGEEFGKAKLEPRWLRDRLAAADQIMRSAPLNIFRQYEEFDEADLQERADRHASDIEAEAVTWPGAAFSAHSVLIDLAVHIRSLDDLLRSYDARAHVRTSDPASHWKDTHDTSYVIPTRRPRRFDAKKGEGFRSGYHKRGTLHHRIIPSHIHDVPVRVLTSGILACEADAKPFRAGGAFFEQLKLQTEPVEKGFRASAVSIADMDEIIPQQIAALSDCHFTVWPELTIDAAGREVISAGLKRQALHVDDVPAFVVAGSWHCPDKNGTWRNQIPLLDGRGRLLGWYSKMAKYGDKDLGFEIIESGEEFVVVVTDDCIAAVCICKDFCDLAVDPWAELPVDVVVVTSMGDDKTMSGHLVRATTLRAGRGRKSFIVQQNTIDGGGSAPNYLLGAPNVVPTKVEDTYVKGAHEISTISG